MSMNVPELVASFQSAKLQEAYGDPVDVTEFLRDTPGFSFNANSTFSKSMYATQIYDRSDGRYRPVYEHEQDLKIIRAMSWLLYDRVPMAKAWSSRLLDYTIGTGFDWSIASSKDDKQLKDLCTGIIDRTLIENKWDSLLERESYEREVVDGEFIAGLVMHDGNVEIEVRECDELTQPALTRDLEDWIGCSDRFESSWSFGVHTRKNRPDKPFGYHVVRDQTGNDWDYIPESQALHWKRNVRAKAKRGFSDFYTPHVYIARGDKVFTNTAEGAAIQAAIAYIVEHAPNTTQSQAAALTSAALLQTGRTDPQTGVSERVMRMKPGQRLDVKAGQKYHNGPIGAVNNQIYIQVMSAALRLAGTVKAFPEGMLTGDYSNNNMASSLVAQSPFVQGRIAEQNERSARMKEMLVKILGMHCERGRFRKWKITCLEDLLARITVNIIPPKVVPMERLQLAQALMIEKQNGWVSDRTAMQELGRDADVEMGTASSDGQTDGVEVVAGAESGVQDTALNGAQVTSLVSVVQQVATGVLPKDSAKAIMRAAFPGVDDATIERIINPVQAGSVDADGNPRTPVDPAQPAQAGSDLLPSTGGEYMGLSRMQWQRNRKAIEDTLKDLASGATTRGAAEGYLMMLGVSQAVIEKLLQDASDGKVDTVLPESYQPKGCNRFIDYP